MKLRPFFSYYGGKYRIAREYPPPRYDTVIEPFAGAAGYATHHHTKKVILYDANPVVAGLWQYLIKVSKEEILSLPIVVTDLRETDLTQEQKWLIGFWLGKANTGTRNKPASWMRKNGPIGNSLYWGKAIRSRVARQVDSIRHWRIYNLPYTSAPDVKACWYIDPPYQGPKGSHYKFHDLDYRALGDWCTSRRGQVMVCEAEGADWLPFKPFVRAQAAAGKHKKEHVSKEVVWYKSDVKVGFGFH